MGCVHSRRQDTRVKATVIYGRTTNQVHTTASRHVHAANREMLQSSCALHRNTIPHPSSDRPPVSSTAPHHSSSTWVISDLVTIKYFNGSGHYQKHDDRLVVNFDQKCITNRMNT